MTVSASWTAGSEGILQIAVPILVIYRLLPKRIRATLEKQLHEYVARRRLAFYSMWPPMAEFAIVCKSAGKRCGIAEQARYLAERLNAPVVRSSRLIKGRKDAVIIEFEPSLYNSRTELSDEIRHASRLSKLVLLDCHQVTPWLWTFSRKCMICVKSLDVAATCGSDRVVVAGLLIPDLKPEHRLPPEEIILGCFGFAFPAKNFDKVIQLAHRLGVKCKIVTSVNTATRYLERLSKQYLSHLKTAASRDVEVIEVFGDESRIVAHLQDCSHILFAEEYESTVSSSMRLAALSGRPIVAMNTRQGREAGAVLIDRLDDITLSFLKNCSKTRITVKDGFEDYAKILGSVLLAPLYSRIAHPDSIYEDDRQKDRIRWIKRNCIGRIVDVGCASGYVTNYVGAELGLDSRPDMVAYATLRFPMIRFKVFNARKQAIARFDTVVFDEIVEHVDYGKALQMIEVWAAQKPQRMLVTAPNADKERADAAFVRNHEHRWLCTRDRVQNLVPSGYSFRLEATPGGNFWLLRMDRR